MKNKSVLDLCFEGKFNIELNKSFNKVSNDLRNHFNSLIEELSEPNKDNIDWWVNELPSRHNLASPFFHYICCIHFVNYLIETNKFKYEKILVDSLELKKVLSLIIRKNYSNKCIVQIDPDIFVKVKNLFKQYFSSTHIFFYNIMKLLIARFLSKSFSSKLPEKDLVLIDTFVIPGYTDSKRWYGSLWENLSSEMQNQTYFVYTITKSSISILFSTYSQLKTNTENYIIKEAYLHFSDLLFAFNYKKRFKYFKVKKIEILNQDITGLIKECLFNQRDIHSIQESLLTYRFIHRLEQKKVRVRLAIDWFEGQGIDKAWNAGFHTFYPAAKTVAYRAFESYSLYLCSYPIPIEADAGVIPHVFAVQGSKTAISVKEFMPGLKTILIPAYKSEYVWQKSNQNIVAKLNNIIVALPITINTSKYIISMIMEICNNEKYRESNYRFILKPHPAISIKTVYPLPLENMPPNVLFTAEKSFSKLLHSANVLITEQSSTCLEAISIGVPVILVKRKDGLFYNPLPEGIDEELFKFCSSGDELKNALNGYLFMSDGDREKLIIKGHAVRGNYFQPITKEGTNRFMDVNQKENHIHA